MRQFPSNPEAEATVLASVLLRGQAQLVELRDVLQLEDFYAPAHRAVWSAMLAVDDRRDPLDLLTVDAQLVASGESKIVGGLQGLNRLTDRFGSAHNVAHHARTLRDLGRRRAVIDAALQIAERGMQPGDDPEFIDAAEEQLLAATTVRARAAYKNSKELLTEFFATIRARATGKPRCVWTPWEHYNRLTGGLQPGELTILAARPSMGKTAAAMNIATGVAFWSMAENLEREDMRRTLQPTLFFSVEMASVQLTERVMAGEAGVDGRKLRAGDFVEDELRALLRAGDRLMPGKLFVDDVTISLVEMRARARRWRRDRSIWTGAADEVGLVVVDYLQLCTAGDRRYDSREQEVAAISKGLKGLAKELACPVLALCQLNRAADARANHRPQLADLRESGAIEQDADVVAFVYREERYMTGAPPEALAKVKGLAEIIIEKQRSGPVGTVPLHYCETQTRFRTLERP